MIRVFPDLESASDALARHILQSALAALDAGGRFDLVLSGGSTPRRTYEILAELTLGNRALWNATHVYWGDERYVPHDDLASNHLLARRTLLDRVEIPRENVHPVPTDGGDPSECARRYADEFPESADAMLLGMGDDGHTASLFPGTPQVGMTGERFLPATGPVAPRQRITATRETIISSREILILTAGTNKANALQRVFASGGTVDTTPARIAVDGTWFVDVDAAALLRSGATPPDVAITMDDGSRR